MDESDRVSLVTAIFFAVLSIPLALFLSYAGYKTFSQRWPHMKVLWSLFALSIICEALGMVVVSTQPATSLPNAIGWAGEALSYVGELMLGVWSTWFCILGVLYRAGRSTATSGQPTRRDVTLLAVLIAVFIAVGLAQVTIAVGGLALGLRTGVIAVPVAFAIAFLVLHRTLRWRRDSGRGDDASR